MPAAFGFSADGARFRGPTRYFFLILLPFLSVFLERSSSCPALGAYSCQFLLLVLVAEFASRTLASSASNRSGRWPAATHRGTKHYLRHAVHNSQEPRAGWVTHKPQEDQLPSASHHWCSTDLVRVGAFALDAVVSASLLSLLSMSLACCRWPTRAAGSLGAAADAVVNVARRTCAIPQRTAPTESFPVGFLAGYQL